MKEIHGREQKRVSRGFVFKVAAEPIAGLGKAGATVWRAETKTVASCPPKEGGTSRPKRQRRCSFIFSHQSRSRSLDRMERNRPRHHGGVKSVFRVTWWSAASAPPIGGRLSGTMQGRPLLFALRIAGDHPLHLWNACAVHT